MSTIAAPTVLITVPKFVSITPNRTLPKLQPALKLTDNNKMLSANQDGTALRATSPASSGYASSDGTPPKGKKRRLDHLTWEEKIQRKKLKNRVAAQTSRDRKKARMEDMEHEIKELKEQSEILRNKCDSLININDSLLEKNGKLDKEVEILRQQLEDIKKQQQLNNATAACQNCAFLALNGSAVSTYTDPLQQGSLTKDQQNTQIPKAATATTQQISALWKIITLCLLYKTCSSSMSSKTSMKMTSMPIGWKNWQKACLPISQQTWKQAIARATKLLPKLQATQSACLDQWWGPQQNAWNPTDIKLEQQEMIISKA